MFVTHHPTNRFIPSLVVDNLFVNPDDIVDIANSVDFAPSAKGFHPGLRSKMLSEIDKDLYTDLMLLFISQHWNLNKHRVHFKGECYFQKVPNMSYEDDPFTPENGNWIHRDNGTMFAGVVYLNKNYELFGGTTLHKFCDKVRMPMERTFIHWEDFFIAQARGEKYDQNKLDEYRTIKTKYESQFETTLYVNNVYNRLFMYDSSNLHSVPFFSTTSEYRLTIVFFVEGLFFPV